jgi:hypothetical protein
MRTLLLLSTFAGHHEFVEAVIVRSHQVADPPETLPTCCFCHNAVKRLEVSSSQKQTIECERRAGNRTGPTT